MKTFRLVLCFLVCCFAGVFSSATASQEVCTKGPFSYKKGDRKILDCDFTGAAIRDILWYKDNKLLVNGSGGLYQSLTRLNHDTLRSSLLFQFVRFKHAGVYTCKPEPSQPVSNCPDGKSFSIVVECGNWYMKAYDALVSVKKFSNATLRCSAMAWLNCFLGPDLTWYHGNKTLKNNTKYTIRKQNTNECKRVVGAEFFLDIWNVTNADVGEYVCQMECFIGKKIKNDSVQLLHYFEEDEEQETTTTSRTTQQPSSREEKLSMWFVPVVCAAVFVAIFTGLCAFKKGFFSRKRRFKYNKGEDVLDNKLFISYSSKDFSWVTENLISLLEKHSIPYRIHIRDFELGRPIVQNMAESVYNSRQVLVVLSNNYLASNFCREELHMALQRGVDTGDSTLVLVKIDNKLKKKQLPLALRAKNLLDFEKYKEKQDWEKKILNIVSDQKSFSVHV
ncbi:toll-like receptor 1 [Montipora capricornis]|uniref:toll-like receptor 1 n=1 Tax=Montipora capricornis TaxID=246305 RepID=UPI0035F1E41C